MPVSNVPSPGSPIRSNWAVSVSNVANANETLAARLAFDTGWKSETLGAGTWGGFFHYRRIGGIVTVNFQLQRTGANIVSTPTNPVSISDLTCRPSETIYGMSRVTGPVDNPWFEIRTGGGLNWTSLSINQNSLLAGSVSYPVTLP